MRSPGTLARRALRLSIIIIIIITVIIIVIIIVILITSYLRKNPTDPRQTHVSANTHSGIQQTDDVWQRALRMAF